MNETLRTLTGYATLALSIGLALYVAFQPWIG